MCLLKKCFGPYLHSGIFFTCILDFKMRNKESGFNKESLHAYKTQAL